LEVAAPAPQVIEEPVQYKDEVISFGRMQIQEPVIVPETIVSKPAAVVAAPTKTGNCLVFIVWFLLFCYFILINVTVVA
jgi:hypothetical protein